ncbi:mucin-12-like [Bradysia coprophila]|uniref:mucin-12-like n=1 Tax=Bradysia coprophila TaxID=38358 RepID=UPI00187DC0D5|nr:mucin-12-like [Bradysia coprophila]
MKFVVLLLFSPLVASSFTSLCPQQPNNVVVNCNNQNPFTNPLFPGTTIPVTRGRVLDVGYNTHPRGSTLEFQRRRSDSSEESSASSESEESSEELVDHQIPFYPTHTVNRPQNPSIHTTTTLDSKLDFLRHGTGGTFRNDLRTAPRRKDVRAYVSSTRNDLSVNSDETHGHGHSGQYNHDAHEHSHHHGHNHHHGHGHGHHHHVQVPTHVTHPINTVVGTQPIPEHVVPIGSILSGAPSDIFVNQGNFNMDRGEPRIDSPIVQVSAVYPSLGQAEDILRDTYDRLMLTQRGYRALRHPSESKTTYELESLLGSIVPMMSVPTVLQEGLNTEINCDPIPLDSGMTQITGMQGMGGLTPLNEAVSTVSHGEMSPDQQISTTFTITENEDVNAQDLPLTSHAESTVTKVEERPVTTGINIPMEESSGTTVTKVTTTKIEKRPTASHIGSTVTKVTTTKTQERPMSTQVVVPTEQHMGSTVTKVTTTTSEKLPIDGTSVQTSSNSGSTITTVTTTKTEERPIDTVMTIPETIVNEGPVQTSSSSGSTITTVTTTNTEERPVNTDMTMPETIVNEGPVLTSSNSGSTITRVTTTETEGRPVNTDMTMPETIVNEGPVQTSSSSGSTITRVTTTRTEGRPIISDFSLPETIIHETPVETAQSSSKVTTTTTTDERPIATQLTEVIGGGEVETLVPEVADVVSDVSGLARLVRPTRDGTYRFDRYRQRMSPVVFGF